MRRNTNGRSPLVNQQRQITSFFSKSASPSPSSILSDSKSNNKTSKLNPNPTTPSPSPPTPSPSNPKPNHHKPLLLIGASPPTPSSSSSLYSNDVIGKRIKVYWPIDKAWYEGTVKSFDNATSKHLVLYDDDEEESLDLSKEKFEWVQDSSSSVRKLKRLRRSGDIPVVRKMVIDDDEDDASPKGDDDDDDCGGDDSSDEDWGKNAVGEATEEEEDVVLDDEEEDDENASAERSKRKSTAKVESKKRKMGGAEKPEPAKKSKSAGEAGSVKGAFKFSLPEPTSTSETKKTSNGVENVATDDASERFATREAQKFRFLREDRRDAKRRRPGDENYDPRTLYLPPDFLRSLSDGQKQWWEFKSKHMDKVLFFKMGKFYELFEMDAHVGAKELDLQYMK
ncbi:hypothetical protein PIB30_062967, partial [Stylosanthes scabra]|nr:hypothetical protein [Stylosanthes scabra]